MKKIVFASAILALSASPTLASAECQPKMIASLAMLQAAQSNLQAATADKGGHRAKALQLIKKAIDQVQAGMRFDNRHDTERRMDDRRR